MGYCHRVRCLICGASQAYSFSKPFHKYGLSVADYWTCPQCGFTASKTHHDMTDAEWSTLNADFHHDHFAREDNPYNRNQRYFNQALMLMLLARWDLVRVGAWLDWGSADGRLSAQLERHFGLVLNNFDRYLTPARRPVEASALVPRGYDLVVNCTPLGMKDGDPLPFDVARLAPSTFVGEVVMKAEVTPLVKAARERGCRTQVGTDMLFEQIPAYLEFFGFGTTTPEDLRSVAKIQY